MTSFELDFFGRVRNLSEAAFQQYLATAQARRTVHINLVAQVAEAYFRLRTTEQLKALMQSTQQSRTSTLELVQARYDGGVASRSAERRVGQGCVRPCRFRGSPSH